MQFNAKVFFLIYYQFTIIYYDCTEIFDIAKKNPEQLKIRKDCQHTQKDLSRTLLFKHACKM